MEDVSHSHFISHSYANTYSEACLPTIADKAINDSHLLSSTGTRPNTHPQFQVVTLIPHHLRPTSTLHPTRWQELLRLYPDPSFPQLLADIAKFGTRIGYEGPHVQIWSPNHTSIHRISKEITANICSELAEGRLLEIHSLPQFFVISPLGAVKKMSGGIQTSWRRIYDLSFPQGSSVNDGIPKAYGSLIYETLDQAVALISKHGRGTCLRKRDLKDAFRRIPVSPLDYWLLLFEWQGRLYIDIFLPFGLRTSPFIFNLFGEGLHWIFDKVFHRELVHYLDDFLFINDPDPELFGVLAAYLGLFEQQSKREDGCQVTFLGIEIDTEALQLRLPQDKYDCALSAVHMLLRRSSISSAALEKVLGFLSFCARVIPLGRPFLRNLFNLLQCLSHLHPHSRRRISVAARRDLLWWAAFLPRWSHTRLIRPTRPSIIVYTDASGSKGIGGWWGQYAFSARLPRAHRQKHIDWKEAYAILFALAKWGNFWKGYNVLFKCNNEVVVSSFMSKTVKGEAINPLQLIFLAAALLDIEVQSEWLSSKENWTADALSRFQIAKVANLFPQFLDPTPPHRETGNPVPTFLKKLRPYFGMGLPLPLEQTTPLESVTMSNFSSLLNTVSPMPFQPTSKLFHSGMQN